MSAPITPPPKAAPAPTMTAEEFGRTYSGDHVEYVNGRVKEMPMAGGKHGNVCFNAAFAIGQFILANQLGRVFTNDTFVHIPTNDDPERVYGPDVFFASYERLAKDAEIPTGTVFVVPNLVVEVKSPTDLWTDAIGKAIDYIRVGVAVAIILDPKTRTASVFRSDEQHSIIPAEDELTLPEVLPGFAVRVAELFA